MPWSIDVDRHLRDRRAQPVRAARADDELDPVGADDHRRRLHAGEARPRRHAPPGRQVLLAHHVVQVQAGAGHDHAGVAAVRRGVGAGVAVGVDHRDVRRAVVGRHGRGRRRRPREGRGHGRPPAADRLVREHVPGEAAAVQELLEAAIAHPPRRAHRLGIGAQGAGAAGRKRLGDAAQHRQHVPDQHPARRRRRVGDDLAAAVVGHPQRPPPHRPVGGQVGHRQPPAGRVLVVDHRGRQAAVVEVARPQLGQPLDRAGQLRLAHALALAHEPPARREHGPHLGCVLEHDLDREQHRLLAARRGDALVRRGRRGHQQVAPRPRPEAPVHGREPGDDAGDGAGGRADVEHLGRLLVERHVDRVDVRQRPVGGRSRPGMAVNASSRWSLRVPAGRTSRKPPPHGLISPARPPTTSPPRPRSRRPRFRPPRAPPRPCGRSARVRLRRPPSCRNRTRHPSTGGGSGAGARPALRHQQVAQAALGPGSLGDTRRASPRRRPDRRARDRSARG